MKRKPVCVCVCTMGTHLLSSIMCNSCLPLLLLLILGATQPALCTRKPAGSSFATRSWHSDTDSTSLWESVSEIPDLKEPEFREATRFLLQMCLNAYNYDYYAASPGLLPDPALLPIPGWHLSETVPPIAPPRSGAAGLRAFVYEEDPKPLMEDSSRAVLVFHGWQISSTSRDELADLCAGKRLFPKYTDFLSPPSHLCSSYFNESDLDYLSQAIAYTRTVLRHYAASSLLLTGHSFGAGLAVLVSAALQDEHHKSCSHRAVSLQGIYTSHEQRKVRDSCRISLPVVSFSGPGTHRYLHKRGWKLHNKHHIISISHDWDFFGVRARWRDHRGWLCLYDAEEPDSCKDCFSDELRVYSVELLKSRALSIKVKAKKRVYNSDLDDDGGDNSHDDDDDDDDDDDEDNDNDDDDCPCHYDDEPCWDCLADTHSAESVMAVADRSSKPACKYLD